MSKPDWNKVWEQLDEEPELMTARVEARSHYLQYIEQLESVCGLATEWAKAQGWSEADTERLMERLTEGIES